MAGKGHNSGDSYGVAADELRQFVERIESVEEEMRGLRGDRSEIYAEAKGRGYDTKTIRKLIAIRKQKPDQRAEDNAILGIYGNALGIDVFG